MVAPELQARERIDALLVTAGWQVVAMKTGARPSRIVVEDAIESSIAPKAFTPLANPTEYPPTGTPVFARVFGSGPFQGLAKCPSASATSLQNSSRPLCEKPDETRTSGSALRVA